MLALRQGDTLSHFLPKLVVVVLSSLVDSTRDVLYKIESFVGGKEMVSVQMTLILLNGFCFFHHATLSYMFGRF